MPMRFRLLPAAMAILCAVALHAQVAGNDEDDDSGRPPALSPELARYMRLMHNLGQAKVTASADRALYFPGEAMKLTLTVTNPTSQPLEIPDPNDPGTQRVRGCIADSEAIPLDPANPPGAIRRDVHSVILQPGQSVTLTADSEDEETAERWCLGPTGPGEETMKFLLGGTLTVQTGSPLLEASALVPLQVFHAYQGKDMKQPKTVQKAAAIVAARLNGEHVVMVAQHNVSVGRKIVPGRDGALSPGDVVSLAPWVRLATVTSKVTKLSGTADATGRITLEYTTEDGGGSRVYLDQNRHPL